MSLDDFSRITPPSRRAGGVRTHRDRDRADGVVYADSDHSSLSSVPWLTRRAAALEEASPVPNAEPFVAQLRRGHRWMRFATPIERQFQIDASAAEWRRIIGCSIVAQLSLWFCLLMNRRLAPEMVDQLMPWWITATAGSVLWLGGLVCIAPARRRVWQVNLLVMPQCVLLLGALLTYTRTDTLPSAVMSVNMLLVVMWSCLLARQRFWFAFVLGVGALVGWAVVPPAVSPVSGEILWSNVRLVGMATVFALGANYLLEYQERRAYLLRQLEVHRRAAVADATERLRQLSLRDPLTGLYNRRQFDADFEVAWTQALFSRQPLALLMVDVDFFKRFNDHYGHPVGDGCLGEVATVLHRTAAETAGTAARLGGEEFGLLLPGRTVAEAARIAQAVCDEIAALRIPHAGSQAASCVTVSIGAVAMVPSADAVHAGARARLLGEADAALYEAKQAGRNRVGVRQPVPDTLFGAARDGAHAATVEGPSARGASGASLPDDAPPAEAAARVSTLPSRGASPAVQIEAALRSGVRLLRFPRGLETDFQQARTAPRKKQLWVHLVGGLVLYLAYTSVNHGVTPDVVPRVLDAQLTAVAIVLLAGGLLGLVRARPAREAVYALAVSSVSLGTIHLFSQSRSPLVYAGHLALFLIPMYAAIAARLPFRFACVPSLVTLAGFLALLRPVTPDEQLMALYSTTFLLTAIFFVLLASYMLEHGERVTYLLRRLDALQREALADARTALQRLSTLDPLTGIGNRRSFEADLTRAWVDRAGEPVSMLIVDVDYFKPFNDGYGHLAGDACLKRLATVLNEVAESEDSRAARLGGEEFGVLLPGQDLTDALRVGERLRAAVVASNLSHGFSAVAAHVTVSVGAACRMAGPVLPHQHLFAAADAALYLAKSEGRNRVAGGATAATAARYVSDAA